MKRKVIHTISLHIFIFAAVTAYLAITINLKIYCPFKYITGLTCPACGATRAMFSLFRGDLAGYASYNPFSLPLLAMLVTFPHLRTVKSARTSLLVFCILVATASFVYNIARIICPA